MCNSNAGARRCLTPERSGLEQRISLAMKEKLHETGRSAPTGDRDPTDVEMKGGTQHGELTGTGELAVR